MTEVINTATATVEFDMGEVHGISLDLMRTLEEDGITIGLGVAALALSLGRLLSQNVLEEKDEIKFTQDILEYASMYFVPGGIN